MQLFYAPQVRNNIFQLDETDSKHCVQVLRHNVGDLLVLADGLGLFYEAQIEKAHPKCCSFVVKRTWHDESQPSVKLHIAIAPPKNIARLEWFLEKVTEIGIAEITPLITQRSERSEIKPDRLQKILVAAMKQSLKAQLPQLHAPLKFKQFIQAHNTPQHYPIRCIPTVNPQNALLRDVYQKGQDALMLIGPEGDFTPQEVQMATDAGFVPVSLGKSVLRVETAGVFVCSLVQIANQ